MTDNMSDNKLEFEGEVIDSCKGKFMVRVSSSKTIMCTLSGKIRMNSVKILVGDRVKIEASVYDPTKGRIVYRIKS